MHIANTVAAPRTWPSEKLQHPQHTTNISSVRCLENCFANFRLVQSAYNYKCLSNIQPHQINPPKKKKKKVGQSPIQRKVARLIPQLHSEGLVSSNHNIIRQDKLAISVIKGVGSIDSQSTIY
ncbi:hypothetical protein ABW19_dt0204226 [Dactylella cylindrospora]|nr:hypothetical protein ABW19_dt0204226 [Dactylella cylindrospora]